LSDRRGIRPVKKLHQQSSLLCKTDGTQPDVEESLGKNGPVKQKPTTELTTTAFVQDARHLDQLSSNKIQKRDILVSDNTHTVLENSH